MQVPFSPLNNLARGDSHHGVTAAFWGSVKRDRLLLFMCFGVSSWSEGVFQVVFAGYLLDPRFSIEGTAALHAATQGGRFVFILRMVDVPQPVLGPRVPRSSPEVRSRFRLGPPVRRRPRPGPRRRRRGSSNLALESDLQQVVRKIHRLAGKDDAGYSYDTHRSLPPHAEQANVQQPQSKMQTVHA